jgi:hypothetical protein
MLIHNVFFWLRKDLTPSDLQEFEKGLRALTTDPGVRTGYFGVPGKTLERPVVETTYSYGLILVFDDVAAEGRYQNTPVHVKFLEDHKPMFERVVVYDVQSA